MKIYDPNGQLIISLSLAGHNVNELDDVTVTGAELNADHAALGYYNKHTVTAGEESSGIITVPTYVTGNNSLKVFLNGMLQCITDDYAETDTTTITFVADRLTENDVLILRG